MAAIAADEKTSDDALNGAVAGLKLNEKADNSGSTEEKDTEYEDIDKLLSENKSSIDALRSALGKDLPQPDMEVFPYYDDIFLLRYVLSFGSVEAAVDPIKKTLEWRATPSVAYMLEKCKDMGKEWEKEPIVQTVLKYQVGGLHDCKLDHAPTVIIRPAKGDPDGVFENLTYDELHMLHFAYREIAFRQCDKLTRQTRKMVKQMLVFDMDGVNFSTMMDRRGVKIHQPVSQASALYYPQLQSKFVMKHPPGWIKIVMALMSKVLPAKNMKKVALCPGKKGGDVTKCPYASRYFDAKRVPKFLGGECKDEDLNPAVSGSLVDRNSSNDTFRKYTIAARSLKTISIDCGIPNVKMDWILSVASYGIKMRAELRTDGGETIVLRKSGDEEKIKSDAGVAKGTWELKHTGKLIVTLDNTYSILRSKTVKLSVEPRM